MSDAFSFKSFAGLSTDSQPSGESLFSQNAKPPTFGSLKTGANSSTAPAEGDNKATPFGGSTFTASSFAAFGTAATSTEKGKSPRDSGAPALPATPGFSLIGTLGTAAAATTSSGKSLGANPLPVPNTTDFSSMFKAGAFAGTYIIDILWFRQLGSFVFELLLSDRVIYGLFR